MVYKIEALPEIKNAFLFNPENGTFICSFPGKSAQRKNLLNLCHLLSSHYLNAENPLPSPASPVKGISLSRNNFLFFYGRLAENLFLGAVTTSGNTPFPFNLLMRKAAAITVKIFNDNKHRNEV